MTKQILHSLALFTFRMYHFQILQNASESVMCESQSRFEFFRLNSDSGSESKELILTVSSVTC